MKVPMIKYFLKKLKKLLKKNRFQIYRTDKNIDTYRKLRRDLAITYDDFENEIKDVSQKLDINNYCEGPKKDIKKYRGNIFWVFGVVIFNKEIFNKEIYLKFTLEEKEDEKIICWSCHSPKDTLKYPYRGRS